MIARTKQLKRNAIFVNSDRNYELVTELFDVCRVR